MTAYLSHAMEPRGRSTGPYIVFMSAWMFEVIIQQLNARAYLLR